MIVSTFEEAKPIILEQQAQGKKVGWFAIGFNDHPGRRALLAECRKHSDFVVLCMGRGCAGLDNPEVQLLRYFFDSPDETISFIDNPSIELEDIIPIFEPLVDLIITGFRPFPAQDVLDEVRQSQKSLLEFYKHPNYSFYSERPFESGQHPHNAVPYILYKYAMWLNLHRHYFPIDVRVNCYKDFLTEIWLENTWRDYHGVYYKAIPPLRDDFGMSYSTRYENWRKKHLIDPDWIIAFKRHLKGKPLITSANETVESLRQRLDMIDKDWRIFRFEKYSGENFFKYHKDEGNTYIHITLIAPDKILVFEDAFILKGNT